MDAGGYHDDIPRTRLNRTNHVVDSRQKNGKTVGFASVLTTWGLTQR